jgi:long-subunit acyl-CoA synthetase (AMP-forming)
MIAHYNVISNMMQIRWHEDRGRKEIGVETQRLLGLLPISHIYGLVVVALTSMYRGDGVIVLPKFDLQILLETIQRFKINFMHLVCSLVLRMKRSLY